MNELIILVGRKNPKIINLLSNDVPHIPIMIEDLLDFICLPDFEEDCIKTVQTIGKIISHSERRAALLTLTPESYAEFSVHFKNLRVDDLYMRDSQGVYRAIWDIHNIFKVFGTLEQEGLGTVLAVTYLVPVEDVKGSWRTIQILSILTYQKYSQYCPTEEQSSKMKLRWESMKVEEKRLIRRKS